MKNLRQLCATFVLTLVLTLSAVAGDMSTPGATATGEMSAPGVAALDPVAEAVLSLLQGLLALF